MKWNSSTPSNPLSFSVLDLVMGLVGVILIVSFGLAAQPSKKSNREVSGRYIEIDLTTQNESLGIGFSLLHSGRWLLPNKDSNAIKASMPSTHAPIQLINVKKKLDAEDVLVVFVNFNPLAEKIEIPTFSNDAVLTITCYRNQSDVLLLKKKSLSSDEISTTITGGEITEKCGWG